LAKRQLIGQFPGFDPGQLKGVECSDAVIEESRLVRVRRGDGRYPLILAVQNPKPSKTAGMRETCAALLNGLRTV